ncbi:hypothetical protein G6F22_020030 [Rhizopus arrhizus]|nr:hypothetical protein G6F22_020030 [Rhizopus arrhizus]
MDAVCDDFPDLCMLMLGIAAQRGQERRDRPRPQAVQHPLALAPGLHEAGTAQVLQMLRGIGDRQPGQFGQPFHRAFTLRDVFKQGQAMGLPQRLGDLGKRVDALGRLRAVWRVH